MGGWRREHFRHALSLLAQGRNPAAAVYESLGDDFFLAPAPGWLNLGLWEVLEPTGRGGDATLDEPEAACRRLVEQLASALPRGADVLDVGNGLAAQDPVIATVAQPRSLVALNVTESQLRAGRARLADAAARAVAGDACRIPFGDAAFDGLISVEAAFHFRSRRSFFEEARRVLRPGGVLTMSDVATKRWPAGPLELAAGLSQLRVWGLRVGAASAAGQIAASARAAGFEDLRIELCGDRVFGPALARARRRLSDGIPGVPLTQLLASRVLLAQVELLWRRGVLDYLLLCARVPGERAGRRRAP